MTCSFIFSKESDDQNILRLFNLFDCYVLRVKSESSCGHAHSTELSGRICRPTELQKKSRWWDKSTYSRTNKPWRKKAKLSVPVYYIKSLWFSGNAFFLEQEIWCSNLGPVKIRHCVADGSPAKSTILHWKLCCQRGGILTKCTVFAIYYFFSWIRDKYDTLTIQGNVVFVA